MALRQLVARLTAGDPVSNGWLEGTNSKLGVVKRMEAYGFVNADNFPARGLLLCPGAGS